MLTHRTTVPTPPARVTVLGAGGFLGRMLVRSLQADGLPVLPLGSKDVDLAGSHAAANLASVLRPNDTVVFLSAITRDRSRGSGAFMRNLKMGCAVCAAAAAKKPAQLIYASSDAVYPLTDEIVSERTVVSPTDLYGLMHLAREIMLAEEVQIPLAVLRFTAVYGAGNPHNSYGPNRFIAEALRRGTISLFGAGEELRDHLYIDDAVAVLRSTIAHASGGLLNVASGSSVSFHAVAEMVARVCPGIKIMTLPRQLPIVHRRYEIADTRAAFPRLKFTPIDKGLWATIKNTAPPSALAETWTTQPLDFCGTVA